MNLLKNLSVIIIALITFYVSDIHSQSQWILKSTGCNFNSVFFYDEMVGYVAGDSGTILATVDAGSNWQCLSSGTTQSLKSIFFFNALTGWAAGSGGVIVKTTNSGINWTVLFTGTSTNLTGIHLFIDEYYGDDIKLREEETKYIKEYASKWIEYVLNGNEFDTSTTESFKVKLELIKKLDDIL